MGIIPMASSYRVDPQPSPPARRVPAESELAVAATALPQAALRAETATDVGKLRSTGGAARG